MGRHLPTLFGGVADRGSGKVEHIASTDGCRSGDVAVDDRETAFDLKDSTDHHVEVGHDKGKSIEFNVLTDIVLIVYQ